jgi:hypothetical protein
MIGWILECGDLSPLWFSPLLHRSARGKGEKGKAAINRRTPKVEAA